MASEKVVNYSATETETLVSGYTAGETVEALAEKLGKSVRSVVAKLSREGVYKSKAKAKADKAMTKAELVADVATNLGMSAKVLESLEKGTKEALEALSATVAALKAEAFREDNEDGSI